MSSGAQDSSNRNSHPSSLAVTPLPGSCKACASRPSSTPARFTFSDRRRRKRPGQASDHDSCFATIARSDTAGEAPRSVGVVMAGPAVYRRLWDERLGTLRYHHLEELAVFVKTLRGRPPPPGGRRTRKPAHCLVNTIRSSRWGSATCPVVHPSTHERSSDHGPCIGDTLAFARQVNADRSRWHPLPHHTKANHI